MKFVIPLIISAIDMYAKTIKPIIGKYGGVALAKTKTLAIGIYGIRSPSVPYYRMIIK